MFYKSVFDTSDLKIMQRAYDEVCAEVRFNAQAYSADSDKDQLALVIIDAFQNGHHDVASLKKQAIGVLMRSNP